MSVIHICAKSYLQSVKKCYNSRCSREGENNNEERKILLPKEMMFFSKKLGSTLYRLDVAATIYPALSKKNFNNVYRIGFKMVSPININALKQAVVELAPRFPTIYVQLHKGFFWNYYKKATDFDIVARDSGYPCRPFKLYEGDKPLFRILYDSENNIFAEFFHGITDGTGSFAYLKTLLAKYLEIAGREVFASPEIFNLMEEAGGEEIEDSYMKYYQKKGKKVSRWEPNAYQYRPVDKGEYLGMVSARTNTAQLRAIAKSYDCGLTELLLAVYGLALCEQKTTAKPGMNKKRAVRICTPVNLRQFYESKSIRNFVMIVNFDIDLKKKPEKIEDILPEIKERAKRQWTKEFCQPLINKNVQDATMLITRVAPLFLKTPIIKIGATMYGEGKYTTTLTNVGLQKLPKFMEDEICDVWVLVGPTRPNAINCSVVGVNDLLRLTFTSISDETVIQKNFFQKLSDLGLEMEIIEKL